MEKLGGRRRRRANRDVRACPASVARPIGREPGDTSTSQELPPLLGLTRAATRPGVCQPISSIGTSGPINLTAAGRRALTLIRRVNGLPAARRRVTLTPRQRAPAFTLTAAGDPSGFTLPILLERARDPSGFIHGTLPIFTGDPSGFTTGSLPDSSWGPNRIHRSRPRDPFEFIVQAP